MPDRMAAEFDAFAAWHYLAHHPRLRWLPPLWRERDDMDTRHLENLVVRSVERNLVVSVESEHGTSRFVLRTGPLEDLRRGGDVDPVTPAMEIDDRLCGAGESFEAALASLARQVERVYDDVGSATSVPITPRDCEHVAETSEVADYHESSICGSTPPSSSGSMTPLRRRTRS